MNIRQPKAFMKRLPQSPRGRLGLWMVLGGGIITFLSDLWYAFGASGHLTHLWQYSLVYLRIIAILNASSILTGMWWVLTEPKATTK